MGRDTPLRACLEPHERYEDGYKMASELRDMYNLDADVKKVVDVAKGLEGLRRQDGIHAAAVVITKEPLTEYLPIQRKPEGGQDPEGAPVVTQYEMHGVEDLGLLKMDFLGLRNLDVITDTLELIEQTQGVTLDIDDVDLNDTPTYKLLSRGDSIGVFQLESSPMRALMRSLAPTSFDDVAALVALYRPGPMAANMHNDYADRKNGRKPVEYLHPDAEEVLADTYGLMIFQESVMRVAQKFAGYSLADADNLRRACGKKIREKMREERDRFVRSCDDTGYGADLGQKWFDIIEPFADYAFPRAHAYGYGYIAYQIAYLKTHYPVEYLAALLTSVKASLDKAAVYLNECRLLGIEVAVPDINLSDSDFRPVPDRDSHPAVVLGGDVLPPSGSFHLGAIVFGLSAVRNVGEGLVEQVLVERKNGPFVDFYDFCQRVDMSVLNKRAIESMIKAGCFDSLGHPRKGLLSAFEQIIDQTVARRREHEMGVMSLFGETSEGPTFDERTQIPDVEFDKTTKLTFEKEMLGVYISDHPLMGAEAALRRKTDCTVAELLDAEDGAQRRVGGVVAALQRKWTKRGDLMAVFQLEDLTSSIEVMVFPKTMTEFGHKLVDDAVVVLRGRVDKREDAPKFIPLEIEIFEVTESVRVNPLRLRLSPNAARPELIDELKRLLHEHPGAAPVHIQLGDPGQAGKLIRLSDEFRVDTTNGLVAELRVLLGPDAIHI
jgi:DNA polymerase III subunit alpha